MSVINTDFKLTAGNGIASHFHLVTILKSWTRALDQHAGIVSLELHVPGLATLGWVGKRPWQSPSSPMPDVAPRAEALVRWVWG